MWIDSHCHLQLDDRGDTDALVSRARDAAVDAMICVGTDLETSRAAVHLAAMHEDVHAVVGLHPHEASRFAREWDAIEALLDQPGVVGVGEAGFDLHYEHSPRADQEIAFRYQIAVAKARSLPLVIHSREAWDETFRVLDEEGAPVPTVFHCFTGGTAEAQRALALGAHLSFSGIVSFKAAADVRAAAAITPADRLLVETDSPYLAPEPHRGRPNEPAYVGHVGAAVAAARQVDPAVVAHATAATTRRVFGLATRTSV